MAEDVLFSESWHLVARLRPVLRTDLRSHRQVFRGETWRVLGDAMRNEWFRVRAEAWRFLARLDGTTTVEEAWQRVLDEAPESAPGQQEVVQLLAQLHGAGLLRGDLPADGASLFQRLRDRRRREVQSQWMNFLFLRLPLFDPQRLLVALTPAIRALFSRVGAVVWFAAVVAGAVAVAGHADRFLDQTQGLFAPGNLIWLYLAWTGLKLAHELAHAAAVRRRGGEVHVLGVTMLVFTPVPFVDGSAAWGFRRRSDRLLVGAAGMMSDLALAGLAAVVWAGTGEGLVNSVAHNLVVIGSVATLAFNANPLLRFDGYYLLADLLDQPNLAGRANQQVQAAAERWLWGRRETRFIGRTPRESFWLGAYGVAAAIYRVFVMVVIIRFVAGQLFELGLLLAVVAAIGAGVVPLGQFAVYLAKSPSLRRCRARAIGVTLGALAFVAAFLLVVPMPHHFRAPGVVRAREAAVITAATDGIIRRVLAQPGAQVTAGEPLLAMENPELDAMLDRIAAEEAETSARARWARDQAPGMLAPLAERAEFLHAQRTEAEARRAALTVRAPHAGRFLAPYAEDYPGAWVTRGTELGSVIDDRGVYFSSVVAQSEAVDLFHGDLRGGEVWLPGSAGSPLPGGTPEVVPVDRSHLPSAALGWLAGGDVRVTDDKSGRATTEPFYEVRLPLAAGPALRHLRTGTARYELPPAPWAVQGWRALRQLLQDRYHL